MATYVYGVVYMVCGCMVRLWGHVNLPALLYPLLVFARAHASAFFQEARTVAWYWARFGDPQQPWGIRHTCLLA